MRYCRTGFELKGRGGLCGGHYTGRVVPITPVVCPLHSSSRPHNTCHVVPITSLMSRAVTTPRSPVDPLLLQYKLSPRCIWWRRGVLTKDCAEMKSSTEKGYRQVKSAPNKIQKVPSERPRSDGSFGELSVFLPPLQLEISPLQPALFTWSKLFSYFLKSNKETLCRAV